MELLSDEKDCTDSVIDEQYLVSARDRDELECFQTKKGKNQIDLSRTGLEEIPKYIIKECNRFLTHLYINENKLRRLPEDLFPNLLQLKWLDARNNLLTEIPATVAHHPCLEILLLQGNFIKRLPLELGLVPNLRGVQLLGNPIQFPSEYVLSQGIQYILQYLNEEWKIHCQSNIRPIEEPFYKKKYSQTEGRHLKSKSALVNSTKYRTRSYSPRRLKTSLPSLSVISYKPGWKNRNNSKLNTSPIKNLDHEEPSDELKTRVYPSMHYTIASAFKDSGSGGTVSRCSMESKIYETLLRDMWISKIKFILDKQNGILQKRKDIETLHRWRKDTQNNWQLNKRQLQSMQEHGLTIPFDTDENYMKMLSRSDIQNPSAREAFTKQLNVSIIRKSVSEEMSEVLTALHSLEKERTRPDTTPRSEQKALGIEIAVLMELQKRLQSLRLHTSEEDKIYTQLEKKPILVTGKNKTSTK